MTLALVAPFLATAKVLSNLYDSIRAAILDVLYSREKTDEQTEAVVSQMFVECMWEILTKDEEQGPLSKKSGNEILSRTHFLLLSKSLPRVFWFASVDRSHAIATFSAS